MKKRAREIVKPALERIEEAEAQIRMLNARVIGLTEGSNKAFTMVEERLDINEQLANAFSELLGDEKVQEVVKRHIMERATKRAEMEKSGIAEAVKEGSLKVVEAIDVNCVIVGREILKNGEIRHPGWQQLLIGQVREEVRGLLIGKKVGDKVDVPAGQFEILEIYEIVVSDQHVAVEKTEDGAALAPASVSDEPVIAPAEVSEADADQALEEYLADGEGGDTEQSA